jgi:hypothetical protein
MDDNWAVADFSTNNSYVYANGTTQNLYKLIVRDYFLGLDSGTFATNLTVGNSLVVSNDLAVGADAVVTDDFTAGGDATVGGNLVVSNNATVLGAVTAGSLSTTGSLSAGTLNVGTFLNTSNDMAVSFMGYPKVTLTTNMFSSFYSGGTGYTWDGTKFSYLIDGNLLQTNCMAQGTGQAPSTYFNPSLKIDLGTNYIGWVSVYTTNWLPTTAIAGFVTLGSSRNRPTGVGFNETGQTSGNYGDSLAGTNTFVSWVQPFVGRYITYSAYVNYETAGYIAISEVIVHATPFTNQVRNLTNGNLY